MQSRRKLMQKTLAFIAVFVLLVMMLPTAAFAAGNGKGSGKSSAAYEAKDNRIKGADDQEELEDAEEIGVSEEMSMWAMYVHRRKIWARASYNKMSPGHANLLDKLLTLGHELLVLEPDGDPVEDRITQLDTFYTENFEAEAALDVKSFMAKIKVERAKAAETTEAIA